MNGVKDMNRIDRASGPSVFRPVLRVLCLLAALLLVAAAAAGEGANPDWEERLALARAKYNEKTVNVYERGRGKYRKGKINACYYPSDIKPYININVRESLQITDEAEIENIFHQGVIDIREFEAFLTRQNETYFEENHQEVIKKTNEIISK